MTEQVEMHSMKDLNWTMAEQVEGKDKDAVITEQE